MIAFVSTLPLSIGAAVPFKVVNLGCPPDELAVSLLARGWVYWEIEQAIQVVNGIDIIDF